MMSDVSLVTRLVAGDVRALARAITCVENEAPEAGAVVGAAYGHRGAAVSIGITGPPGAGKSTLVDRLIAEYRQAGQRVAVLAVDPSSPFTGGAILGDRVRMGAHATDPGVFIRSMATRGHLGGVARATADAAMLAGAAGFGVVLIETVGVGQDEVEVARLADVCVVVSVPGAGDEVQALKAGVMEIADIYVVNKADRDGADEAAATIEAMLSLDEHGAGAWRPPVLKAAAATGVGVPDLVAAIARFQVEGRETLLARRRARVDWRVRDVLQRMVVTSLEQEVVGPGEWTEMLNAIESGGTDPHTAAAALLGRLRGVRTLDHVAIAARDERAALAFFADAMGLMAGPAESVASQRVSVRFVPADEATIELVTPSADDSPIAKFLDARGPGLHHVALRVVDLAAVLERLEARGIRLIDRVPRPGAHGTRVAFVHPSSAGGVLVELVEHPREPDAHR